MWRTASAWLACGLASGACGDGILDVTPATGGCVSGCPGEGATMSSAETTGTASTGGSSAEPPELVPPRNVLFVLYDDVDVAGDLSPYGGAFATPFAQRVADEGIVATRYYSPSPVGGPTRVGLLSGRPPIALGVTGVAGSGSRRGIPDTMPTIPRVLRAAGFRTGAFGRWDAGRGHEQVLPAGVGFDHSVLDCSYRLIGWENDEDLADATFCTAPGEEITDYPPDPGRRFATALTVDRARAFIDAAADAGEPFYAQIWLHAPRGPKVCPPGFSCPDCIPEEDCSDAAMREFHTALIAHAELELDALARHMVERGLWDETLVIVSSDNGAHTSSLAPAPDLRGSKWTAYERAIRAPLLVRGPGIAAGRIDAPLVGTDLLPTLAALVDATDAYDGPGRSFAGELFGAEPGPSRILAWHSRPLSASTQHALSHPFARYAVQQSSDTARWKLVHSDIYGGHQEGALFDLNSDPGESVDLAPLYPERVQALRSEYRQWQRTQSRLPTPGVVAQAGASWVGDRIELPEVAAGAVGPALVWEDHPSLWLGNFDFTAEFELTVERLPDAEAHVLGRAGEWALRVGADGSVHWVLTQPTHLTPRVLTHPTALAAGRRYRIAATVEQGRGYALWIDDLEARERWKYWPAPPAPAPVTAGDPRQPWAGTIDHLEFYGTALQASDLELGGAYAMSFEPGEDAASLMTARNGTVTLDGTHAHGGTRSLRVRADTSGAAVDGGALGPQVPGAANSGFQVGVWVRAAAAETPVALAVACRDASGSLALPGEAERGLYPTLADPKWRRLVAEHHCPASATHLGIELRVMEAGAEVWWDDVAVARRGELVAHQDFDPITAEVAAFNASRWSPRVGAGRFGTDALPLPSFERTDYGTVQLPGGGAFLVDFWGRSEEGSPVYLYAQCRDDSGAVIPWAGELGNCPDDAPDSCIETFPGWLGDPWRHFSARLSCPAGTRELALAVGNRGEAEVLLDDVVVVALGR